MAAEHERKPDGGLLVCDPLAAALALEDGAALAAEPRHCAVELEGALTRGRTALQAPSEQAPANVLLARAVCMQRLKALLDASTD